GEDVFLHPHEDAGLCARLFALQHMQVHLVAVEVRVVRRTHGQVEAERLMGHDADLVRHHRHPVQRGLPVEQRSEERRVGNVTGVQTCALPIWERMCSCTRMRTRASARASSLCSTCRFISSPSKSALYGGHTAKLKRNVLWGMTRTSCAIIDIRCSEGCRLNSTMSPSTSCRSTVYPISTASATTSAFLSVTRIRRPSGRMT